jgi:adsorption protein B
MEEAGAFLAVLDFVMRETALFAALGFALLGLGDLLVDGVWLMLAAARLPARRRGKRGPSLAALTPPRSPGAMAVFIPAWDEAAVIGAMLRNTLAAFDHADYRLYVGCYPNDPAGIAAVMTVPDGRVRLVVSDREGPTTKADCLNRLWRAMLEDEAAEGRRFKAVVLHDAEDVVHPAELRVLDGLVERHDLVQLPVLPLLDPRSRWIGGHYADEFAEAHGKELLVRQHLGAAIPSAGVGCGFAREALARVAESTGGLPFDADSLTEDYELGLKLRALGGSQAFVRIAADAAGTPVATREYFPATIEAAVAQKARWMTGIALAGWDRLGWSGGLAERWMRMRDRQSVLAALLLLSAYVSFPLWLTLKGAELLTAWQQPPIPLPMTLLLLANFTMLLWRLVMRFAFVSLAYGWRQGLLSIPRMFVANFIAILAARRALTLYRGMRRGGPARWDKTAHAFPADVPPP